MTTASSFFSCHPEHRDGVMKAFFAYHIPHFRLFPGAHCFTSASRQSACLWCGRTRELVRHDDLPPQCQQRHSIQEIDECLLEEEIKANQLLEKASKQAPDLLKRLGSSGQSLATIHHTHGYDPETISQFTEISPQQLSDYEAEMEMLRIQNRKRNRKELIIAKS